MDNKPLCGKLRREFSIQGVILLAYYMLMNVCVSLVAAVDAIVYALSMEEPSVDVILVRVAGNGWGYIATCVLGGIILLLWKKKDFCSFLRSRSRSTNIFSRPLASSPV